MIKFWMDATSGVVLALRGGLPSYQVEDEEGRTHLLIHLAIEEQHEDRWWLWRRDHASFTVKEDQNNGNYRALQRQAGDQNHVKESARFGVIPLERRRMEERFMSEETTIFPSTEDIIDRIAAINRVTGNSVVLENIEVLVNPETGHFVTLSIGEPSEVTGIRMSDEAQGCNDCGAHHWNGEDLPLIFRSGKWFCPNCYEATRSPEEPNYKKVFGLDA